MMPEEVAAAISGLHTGLWPQGKRGAGWLSLFLSYRQLPGGNICGHGAVI